MQKYNLYYMMYSVFEIQLYLHLNLNISLKMLFDLDFFLIEKFLSTSNVTIHT